MYWCLKMSGHFGIRLEKVLWWAVSFHSKHSKTRKETGGRKVWDFAHCPYLLNLNVGTCQALARTGITWSPEVLPAGIQKVLWVKPSSCLHVSFCLWLGCITSGFLATHHSLSHNKIYGTIYAPGRKYTKFELRNEVALLGRDSKGRSESQMKIVTGQSTLPGAVDHWESK